MSENLLPCPFCGAEASFYKNAVDFVTKWSVSCTGCDVNLDACEDDKAGAAAVWNARSVAPQAGDPVEKWAKSEAESIYPDPFASVYSEEESQENSTAASQREAFIEGANWARGVLTPSAASTVEPVSLRQMARRIEEALNSEFGVAEGYGNASWTVAHHLYAAPTTSPEPDAVREKIVKLVEEIMLDKWNDICSDTECHPLDIKQLGRRKLEFSPNHWTRFVGEALAETLAALSRPAHGGELERLRAALTKIEKWFGEFPATGKFWDEQKTDEMSYSACYGSNGERDYMRGVARDALARNQGQGGGPRS